MHNGKPYFHNSKTNQTVWEKPFELLPLEERAAFWKEYTVRYPINGDCFCVHYQTVFPLIMCGLMPQ
jgi:hypothetical protein